MRADPAEYPLVRVVAHFDAIPEMREEIGGLATETWAFYTMQSDEMPLKCFFSHAKQRENIPALLDADRRLHLTRKLVEHLRANTGVRNVEVHFRYVKNPMDSTAYWKNRLYHRMREEPAD